MIAEVIVDITNDQVDKVFDYIARPDTIVGERVTVPFGKRFIEGYVLRHKEKSQLPDNLLKPLGQPKDDYPVLLPEFLALNEEMRELFHLRNVDCMRLFIPTQLRSGKAKPLYVNFIELTEKFDDRELLENTRKNATKQIDLIKTLRPDNLYARTDLNKRFGSANVNKLLDLGVIRQVTTTKLRAPKVNAKQDKKVTLTAEQEKVVNAILAKREGEHLLFGVTGSGKTEVYMHIISKVLGEGKTAILLVPEISLTPQVLSTFTARFGDNVAILHSGLSDGERFDEWQRLRTGQAKIAIGARSAIFAPLTNLGAIILDEEHDPSYKAESNPRFITHDVARLRGKFNKCPVIFGSATPSLESFHRAKQGKTELHLLPNRANAKPMPNIEIVNMCDEVRMGNSGIFSGRLLDELENVVREKNQAMLFINRRGFSSYMICRECGYVAKCEDCDVSLVYHKEDNQLKCHYCNRRYKALTNCPSCGSSYIRMGAMGTQKVVEELQERFPNVKILRMDFDTTKNKNSLNELLETFGNTKPCILVGTQMIAKGHDFPSVTLVGIMNADMSLHFSDFRSTERTYQLITQVAGRAGRAEKEGKVILQTYTPKHYAYRFASNYDYLGFYGKEINLREVANFPPFSKIVRVLITAENKDEARATTSRIYSKIQDYFKQNREQFLYCEAMASPVSRIEKKYRFQILCRFLLDTEPEITNFIYKTVTEDKHPKSLVFVEINPSNMS
ncbi:MAG: primosomal protein N' [Clostridia bacterium]|nr:primosomal protein N' [Clostridia bacterium]